MKLGTSTSLYHEREYDSSVPIIQTLQSLRKAGFKYLDFNFFDFQKVESPFMNENWENWINEIKVESDRLGIEYLQAHACFYPFLDESISDYDREWYEKAVLRSIKCAAVLGVKVIVTHPDISIKGKSDSLEDNVKYFIPLIKTVEAYGMKLAIENMWDNQGGITKYGTTPEELIELMEALNSESVGICWDFAHAALLRQDQVKMIKSVQRYLIATHVSDTHSDVEYAYMHILPLLGPIHWDPIMQTLREIEYKGAFSLEVSHHVNYLPDQLVPQALRFSYEVGNYLVYECGIS